MQNLKAGHAGTASSGLNHNGLSQKGKFLRSVARNVQPVGLSRHARIKLGPACISMSKAFELPPTLTRSGDQLPGLPRAQVEGLQAGASPAWQPQLVTKKAPGKRAAVGEASSDPGACKGILIGPGGPGNCSLIVVVLGTCWHA